MTLTSFIVSFQVNRIKTVRALRRSASSTGIKTDGTIGTAPTIESPQIKTKLTNLVQSVLGVKGSARGKKEDKVENPVARLKPILVRQKLDR